MSVSRRAYCQAIAGPWELGWQAIASIGSVVAIIISALAARAAARAAATAEDQLATQTMPVVVELPGGGVLPEGEIVRFPDGYEMTSSRVGEIIFSAPEKGSDPARISIPVQNVGPGLAEITAAYLDVREGRVNLLPLAVERTLTALMASPYTRLYLPPRGQQRLAAIVSREHALWSAVVAAHDLGNRPAVKMGIGVAIDIEFTDASGQRHFETRLVLRGSGSDRDWSAARLFSRRITPPGLPQAPRSERALRRRNEQEDA
jgi:hypothetical protein